MRTESHTVEAFTIFDAPKLDPIYVVLQDLGQGRGRLTIDCFGWAWSAYWGAMGDNTVREFIKSCFAGYLVTKLINQQRRWTKRESEYLAQVVDAVKAVIDRGYLGKASAHE